MTTLALSKSFPTLHGRTALRGLPDGAARSRGLRRWIGAACLLTAAGGACAQVMTSVSAWPGAMRAGERATLVVYFDQADAGGCGFRIDYGDGRDIKYRISGIEQARYGLRHTYADPGTYQIQVEPTPVAELPPCQGKRQSLKLTVVGVDQELPANFKPVVSSVAGGAAVARSGATGDAKAGAKSDSRSDPKADAKAAVKAPTAPTSVHDTIRVAAGPADSHARGAGGKHSSICPPGWDVLKGSTNPQTGAFTCHASLGTPMPIDPLACKGKLIYFENARRGRIGCQP